jgi:hypothetical protein
MYLYAYKYTPTRAHARAHIIMYVYVPSPSRGTSRSTSAATTPGGFGARMATQSPGVYGMAPAVPSLRGVATSSSSSKSCRAGADVGGDVSSRHERTVASSHSPPFPTAPSSAALSLLLALATALSSDCVRSSSLSVASVFCAPSTAPSMRTALPPRRLRCLGGLNPKPFASAHAAAAVAPCNTLRDVGSLHAATTSAAASTRRTRFA